MKQLINELIERYRDNLFAAAFNVCKNAADADDIVQETFMQYYLAKKEFDSEQHIRAWLIRVAINKIGRASCRERVYPLVEAVMNLPVKYRIVIHLYYYEDYSVREIAGLLKLTESNVKARLSRGRGMLRQTLKEEWNADE